MGLLIHGGCTNPLSEAIGIFSGRECTTIIRNICIFTIKNNIIQNTMKTITLTPTEFLTFKALANKISLFFDYYISKGRVVIDADAQLLNEIGY
jgi:hypothetical protein